MKQFIYMSIITSILSLFGFTGYSKKKAVNKSDVKIIDNRLTEEMIDTTTGFDLLNLIFDDLNRTLPTNYKKEYETVLSWNKSQQAIYMIWCLEAEVNNGGFDQFYFNPSGQFYTHLPEALKLVGATKFAELTEQANAIYEKENQTIKQHQDGTLEGSSESYENNPFYDVDSLFYELYEREDLLELQVDYIRKHKEAFIEK